MKTKESEPKRSIGETEKESIYQEALKKKKETNKKKGRGKTE